MRIGMGYDVHKISTTRPLYLGGVAIPSQYGLEGHSDADVLIHAIVDAILGALGLPDIGNFFSDRDVTWKNIASTVFLQKIRKTLEDHDATIGNIDCTIICERIRLSPYVVQMKNNIAKHLDIHSNQIGVKIKTHEKIGALGRFEGISSMAVVLIQK